MPTWAYLAVIPGLLVGFTVHELGHALAARRAGMEVRGVSLFLFGGYTEMLGEPEDPAADLAVAAAGPAASLGVAGLLGLLRWPLVGPLPGAADVLGLLVVVNLGAAAFNLLPGLPLDGGRVLRAAWWMATGDRAAGDRAAVLGGRVLGALLVAGGIGAALVWRSPFPLGAVAVGWFVHSAAAAEGRAAGARGTPVSVVMAAPGPVLAPDAAVEPGAGWAPVVGGGRVIGLVPPGAQGTAGDSMVLIEPDDVVDAAYPVGDAIVRLERTGRTLFVVDGGRMVGVLAPERLADWLGSGERSRQPD